MRDIDLSLSLMQQHTPDKWDDLPEYRTARATVAALKVINDAAERGVKLVSEYTKVITRNEDQLQYLLQMVDSYCHKFSGMRKTAVFKGLTSAD